RSRFVTGMRGDRRAEANLEVKPVDGSANPYLALGAIVAAGLDGLERDLRLPEPVTVDPASLSVTERRRRGVAQLPSSLGAAIAELERSTVLRDAMGDMLFDSFVATRKGELVAFEGLDDDAVVRAHRWRY
ncbi:MAG TPA: glutamine synthetase, partial [Actinomycetota bacterium]|nr:glutamine synthetase [Actinomycetota bacterium]